MIRGPRHPTLVGMGGIGGGPRVDETDRFVTGPMSPLDTQRRLVDAPSAPGVAAVDASAVSAVSPDAAERAYPPEMATTDVALLQLPDPEPSGQTVAHPPITPPKPQDVAPADAAPKVLVDAPGAMRVIPEDLKETSISLRRVQMQQDAAASGEHATVVDPTRRARGRALVAIVVGVCGVIALAALVVVWARSRNKTSDATASSDTTTKKTAPAKTGDDETATTNGTTNGSDTSSAAPTNATAKTTDTKSSTTAPTSSAAGKLGSIPKGFGRLTVEPVGKTPPAGALVWIGEKSYGPLGSPIAVPCGYRWILAGTPNAKGRLSARLSRSVSVFVQCGATSDTHFKLTLK